MKTLRILLAAMAFIATAGLVSAEPHYNYCTKECEDCACSTCKTTVKCEPDVHECYEIECKKICIPKIRFPWEKCCGAPGCGKVITVKVPKKVEKECGMKKVYKHEVIDVGCCTSCGSTSCTCTE